MAKLTAKTRSKIPTKEFALPGERKYPVNDRAHAINAKARATQQEKKGNISMATKDKIERKANKVLEGKEGKEGKGKGAFSKSEHRSAEPMKTVRKGGPKHHAEHGAHSKGEKKRGDGMPGMGMKGPSKPARGRPKARGY